MQGRQSSIRKWFHGTTFQIARPATTSRAAARVALSLALLSQPLFIGVTSSFAQGKATNSKSVRASVPSVVKALPALAQESKEIQSSPIRPVQAAVVNFRQLADKERKNAQTRKASRVQTLIAAPAPMTIEEPSAPDAPRGGVDSVRPSQTDVIPGPSVVSPSPSASFQGEFDEAVGGGASGTFNIPPDTMGAVGIDKVVVHVNPNYIVQDKTTGARLSVVGTSSFWSSTGATSVFDPRVQYDPYNNRWVVAAVSNPQSASASVLIGVSQTSDPEGTYFLYRFIVGCAPGAAGCNAQGEWADFPMLGFNKNWAAVSWNQFTINTGTFVTGKVIAVDYPTLLGGTLPAATTFTGTSFCFHPATTFSATESTLYLVAHLSSAGATYVVGTMTGTPAAPALAIGATKTRTGGGWTQPGGDILPQQCIPGIGLPTQTCPATLRPIDSGDAQIRSNLVFRNGKLFYPQTIALPAGGLNANSRTAAQWTVLDAVSGDFLDGGRIEDPTATATNGGKWYAYPGIAVNKNEDIVLGFSEFESDGYADSGYTFRAGYDAPGTMRDPFIYKAGEDYYSKTFSGTRNRWGDYSHALIDPVNDRDLWTLQEYSGLRVGTTGLAANDSRWATWWAKISAPTGAGDLLISEFRVRGPNGPTDEFVEVYNASGADLTVQAADASSGFAIAASDGTIRCVIPNGTVIPNKGHYLCVNSAGYSLASYPAGNGTTATGDATFTTDIPENAGIALFNNSTGGASFTVANRLDAVGSTAEANIVYKEGTGYPAISASPSGIDYSFYRDDCGKQGAIPGTASCTRDTPGDTNNNAVDFIFVDTNGTSVGAGQRLGAPGPQNLSSPIQRNSTVKASVIDNGCSSSFGAGAAGNTTCARHRDTTSDPANNSFFGTLSLRRTFKNNTGASVTRLRFRVVDQTTFPAPFGTADLRNRTSGSYSATCVSSGGGCAGAGSVITVNGTTLEQPPSQPNGSAFNSSMSAGIITLATPLAPGATINLQFLLGVQQTGAFRFFINVEALP